MFCRKCGNQLQEDWVAYPKCGEGVNNLSEDDRKRIVEEERARISEQEKQPEQAGMSGCLLLPFKIVFFLWVVQAVILFAGLILFKIF